MVYISLSFSASMLSGSGCLVFHPISFEDIKDILKSEEFISCVNPSHKSYIDCLKIKYGR